MQPSGMNSSSPGFIFPEMNYNIKSPPLPNQRCSHWGNSIGIWKAQALQDLWISRRQNSILLLVVVHTISNVYNPCNSKQETHKWSSSRMIWGVHETGKLTSKKWEETPPRKSTGALVSILQVYGHKFESLMPHMCRAPS